VSIPSTRRPSVGLLHTTCFLSAATVVFATSTASAQGAAPAQPAPAQPAPAQPAPGQPTPGQPTPAGQPEAGASGSVNVGGGSTGFSFGGGADANAPSGGDAGGEKEWVGWNTGGEDASYGLGILGHLGLGYRIGDVSVGEAVSRSGLRIGITGIVRLNRYFGLGFGYEHADADHNNVDLVSTTAGVETFQDIYRDLNSLWLQARFYPVRIDPVAVYIGLAGGPTWESLSSSTAVVDVNTQQQLITQCNASSSVGLGLRGGIGAEFTYVSGAMMFAEIGPDYYAMSEDVLDGCAVGAGSVPQFGFRAGFGFGMEKTRKKYEPVDEPPVDTDGDGIPDANDACPEVAGVANADPLKHGCPPDRDADGVLDQVDACPDVPGVPNADPAKNGCPPPGDRDGDGVTDDVDACVELKGVADADPAKNGCPPDTDGGHRRRRLPRRPGRLPRGEGRRRSGSDQARLPQARARDRQGDRHPRTGAVRHRQGDDQAGERRAAHLGGERAQGAPRDPQARGAGSHRQPRLEAAQQEAQPGSRRVGEEGARVAWCRGDAPARPGLRP